MIKDILILNHDPLTSRIEESFCIPFLKGKGLNVVYLDLSNFFYPEMKARYSINRDYVAKISNEEEIIEFIKKFNPRLTLVISEAKPVWGTRHIYKFLKDNKYKTIKISIFGNSSLVKANLKQKFIKLGLRGSLQSLLFKIYKKVHKLKIWDAVLSSTSSGDQRYQINHPDFETYLKLSQNDSGTDDHIVFLDEYFPKHPEIVYWHKKKLLPFLAGRYYSEMREIFDKIEQVTNKKIIIAAHPKAEYRGDEFGAREIVKGRTAELVRDSALVLMHSSMSASFAVLYDKPIIILTTSTYNKNLKETLYYQKAFANLMGLRIVDTHDWQPTKADIMKLDREKRAKFIKTYLSRNMQAPKRNQDIIYEYIKKS